MILIFVPTMLLLPCSNPSIVGVNIHEEFKEDIFDGNNVLDENFLSIDQPCNEQCDCSTKLFDPICNKASGLSYVSPCHAGCRLYHANENPRCACIDDDIELVDGFCDSDCPIWRYWVFILLLFISIACGMGKLQCDSHNMQPIFSVHATCSIGNNEINFVKTERFPTSNTTFIYSIIWCNSWNASDWLVDRFFLSSLDY